MPKIVNCHIYQKIQLWCNRKLQNCHCFCQKIEKNWLGTEEMFNLCRHVKILVYYI